MEDKSIINNQSGFKVFELVLIFTIIGVLLAIIISTFSGVQAKSRNNDRQKNITLLQKNLELYYAYSGNYPTLAEMNNSNWLKNNMKYLDQNILQDPRAKTHELVSVPTKNIYSYTVTSINGTSCDNTTIKCSKYILTAEYEGGGKFTASSLN